MKPYIIIYNAEQTRAWTVSTCVVPTCIYLIGYNLKDSSHRKKQVLQNGDTMKVVAGILQPSDIVESGAQAMSIFLYFLRKVFVSLVTCNTFHIEELSIWTLYITIWTKQGPYLFSNWDMYVMCTCPDPVHHIYLYQMLDRYIWHLIV